MSKPKTKLETTNEKDTTESPQVSTGGTAANEEVLAKVQHAGRDEGRPTETLEIDVKSAKLAAKEFDASKKSVPFVTVSKEVVGPIMVNGKTVTPVWNNAKTHAVWHVDAEDADSFEKHQNVVFGKILRAD